jgi:hypothetical protein
MEFPWQKEKKYFSLRFMPFSFLLLPPVLLPCIVVLYENYFLYFSFITVNPRCRGDGEKIEEV